MTNAPLPSALLHLSLQGDDCARQSLLQAFHQVRAYSESLVAPLETEDMVVQTMADVSPTRWHLAHTTWFFQTFILDCSNWSYSKPDPQFAYLFNSYYEQVGEQFPRPQRGLLTRPTVARIMDYRREINEAIADLVLQIDEEPWQKLRPVFLLGLHHEQQHQELMLTDIKHVLSVNPLHPAAYDAPASDAPASDCDTTACPALEFRRHPGGIHLLGAAPKSANSFNFDCEAPRHQVLLHDFELANRPVTNAEFLHFIEEGGYRRPEFWASDGWALVRQESWQHPLYWHCEQDGRWQEFSLYGMCELQPDAPACHLSWYEAQAYANFCSARLPLEAELEIGLNWDQIGTHTEPHYHPAPLSSASELRPTGVWEWAGSAFLPYPGFVTTAGALGEYNGKFMSGQMVLKSGSCLTPPGHIRATYRNFFPPAARWQMTGLRLARDV